MEYREALGILRNRLDDSLTQHAAETDNVKSNVEHLLNISEPEPEREREKTRRYSF